MNLNFRTSSYSGGEGNCIAVADDAGRVVVMDTKDKQSPVLRFSADAWQQFANQLKRLAQRSTQQDQQTASSDSSPAGPFLFA